MGTTFDLPSFVGDLFNISPESTPLLSAIGGLTGGRVANDKEFGWEFYDLRDPSETAQKLEGANAPDAEERVRTQGTNVVEIHQEAIDISYTRLSTVNADTALRGKGVPDEFVFQTNAMVKQVALDANASFINGVYAKPADNTAPRKTRGIIQAIVTNVKDMGSTTPDADDILDLFQITYENGAEPATRVAVVGAAMKRLLTTLFLPDGVQPQSRNIGGLNLTAFETDFGLVALMLDRQVPSGTLLALDLAELAPRFLEVPGKGHFFWEPLAKVGSSNRSQLYGEIGLEYGNERLHAKLVDATTPYDAVGVGSGS